MFVDIGEGVLLDLFVCWFDIVEVEYMLKVVNVNIGVVCVVFFLKIELMVFVGIMSGSFLNLFKVGMGVWMFVLIFLVLFFDFGYNCVMLDVVKVEKDIDVINYEKVI